MRWRGTARRSGSRCCQALPGTISRDDVRHLLERLGAAGMERVVAVDLTRDEFAIPVVRVVVPGLEGDPRHPSYRRARARGGGAA